MNLDYIKNGDKFWIVCSNGFLREFERCEDTEPTYIGALHMNNVFKTREHAKAGARAIRMVLDEVQSLGKFKEMYWTTQYGKRIRFTELEDRHLLNILKHLESNADDGIYVPSEYEVTGKGNPFGMSNMYFGEEALKFTKYDELKQLALIRGILD